jgi:hypothetical protein
MRDWKQQFKIALTRFRIEHPIPISAPLFPRFRATLFLLWGVSVAGLVYGRFVSPGPEARTLSLLLTAASWLASLFIVLLHDPVTHIKLLLGQIVTLLLVGLFLPVLTITYSLFTYTGNIVTSIKLVWVVVAILLGYVTVYLFLRTFLLPFITRARYPAMVSSPLLFGLLVINYIAWFWPQILAIFL